MTRLSPKTTTGVAGEMTMAPVTRMRTGGTILPTGSIRTHTMMTLVRQRRIWTPLAGRRRATTTGTSAGADGRRRTIVRTIGEEGTWISTTVIKITGGRMRTTNSRSGGGITAGLRGDATTGRRRLTPMLFPSEAENHHHLVMTVTASLAVRGSQMSMDATTAREKSTRKRRKTKTTSATIATGATTMVT